MEPPKDNKNTQKKKFRAKEDLEIELDIEEFIIESDVEHNESTQEKEDSEDSK